MAYHRPIPEPTGDSKPQRTTSSGIETLVQAEKLMQIAILLPCSAFVGWLLGVWADKAWHQTWISLAGLVFGGISGLVYVVRLVISSSTNSAQGDRPRPQ